MHTLQRKEGDGANNTAKQIYAAGETEEEDHPPAKVESGTAADLIPIH